MKSKYNYFLYKNSGVNESYSGVFLFSCSGLCSSGLVVPK